MLAAFMTLALAAADPAASTAPLPLPLPLPSAEMTSRRSLTTVDGVRISYSVAGKGAPCLFVHGGPGQGSRYFQSLAGARFERFARMVYIDQRGSGLSSESSNYHLDRVVADLDAVRERLGYRRWCLIAHSFGGTIATAYALRYPNRVSKIVLLNSSLALFGPYRQRAQIDFIDANLGTSFGQEADRAGVTGLNEVHSRARSAFGQSGKSYLFLTRSLDWLARINTADDYPRSNGLGKAVISDPIAYGEYRHDYAPDTATIPAPTLLVAGAWDFAVGPDEHRRFRFPRCHVAVLEGGHFLFAEQIEVVAPLVARFLSSSLRRGETSACPG